MITLQQKEEDLITNISLQINIFLAKQNEFANIEVSINNIKQNVKNISSKIAIAILSICPSDACVERSFSCQTEVHSLDSNRMHNDIIEAEISIKFSL